MSMIIIPGAPPAPKQLCEKARTRGLPCTTDQCDHRGGFLLLMFAEGDSYSDENCAPCKACGAEPPQSPIWDEAREAGG